jgi:hypothetical protein
MIAGWRTAGDWECVELSMWPTILSVNCNLPGIYIEFDSAGSGPLQWMTLRSHVMLRSEANHLKSLITSYQSSIRTTHLRNSSSWSGKGMPERYIMGECQFATRYCRCFAILRMLPIGMDGFVGSNAYGWSRRSLNYSWWKLEAVYSRGEGKERES